MTLTDKEYRKLLCEHLQKQIIENKDLCSQSTVEIVDQWSKVFIENSDLKEWDVDLNLIHHGALELLIDFKDTFHKQWICAINDLGRWSYLHELIHRREYNEIKTILKELKTLSDEISENIKHQLAS